ncbi:hypothetical protein [Nocardia shimofusensis]|nr:hypothetical protein [Nocardia shimofusensis]
MIAVHEYLKQFTDDPVLRDWLGTGQRENRAALPNGDELAGR